MLWNSFGGYISIMFKKSNLKLLLLLITVITVVLIIVPILLKSYFTEYTLHLSRLAPLPKSAKIILAERGVIGIFNTEYRCQFTATKEDINKWLEKSPGIKTADRYKPTHDERIHTSFNPSHENVRYAITPIDGIGHGAYIVVNIDYTTNTVEIWTGPPND